MPLKTDSAALAMVMQLLDMENTTKPRLQTLPKKPPFGDFPEVKQAFPRARPEEKGVSPETVAAYIDALRNDKSLCNHSLMLIKDGAVIAEADFGDYDHRIWHVTHSECKSITGLAIGMLIDEGKLTLDSRVVDIFASRLTMFSLAQLTLKNLTVRHLLTMTSGLEFNEAGAVTETDWVRCILDSPVKSEPGKVFSYNSMNTYMLSAIIKEITGSGLMEYLRPRLWEPLGIEKIYWETCPKGIEKGGWGLFICPEDMAKVGWLVMQGGRWNNEQIVSEKWLEMATARQVETPVELCGYDYGYQIWSGRKERSFLFNGMFGQNVLSFPDTGFMAVTNAGNDELFQGSGFFKTTTEFFSAGYAPEQPPVPYDDAGTEKLRALLSEIKELPPRPEKKQEMAPVKRSFWDIFKKKQIAASADIEQPKPALPPECMKYAGRFYLMNSEGTAAVGLMPLLMQALQNNYTRGLRSVGFECTPDTFTVLIGEQDVIYRLPVGFAEPRYADLDFHGEPYRVAVRGKFAVDEDDTPVLKLRISFLETASIRMLKLFFDGDSITLEWDERPGSPYAMTAVETLRDMLRQNPIAGTIAGSITKDRGYLDYLITRATRPTVRGKLVK